MKNDFPATAVVGVIAPFGRGVVRSCVECRSAQRHPAACHGFGPGCLLAPRPIDLSALRR